jgi:hypothetical protein
VLAIVGFGVVTKWSSAHSDAQPAVVAPPAAQKSEPPPPAALPAQKPEVKKQRPESPKPEPEAAAVQTPEPDIRTTEQTPVAEGVVRQVLPEIPPKAAATIHGKVPLNVRVHVSPAGAVTETEVISGAKSYFAPFAAAAAKSWQFKPEDGAEDRVWNLRFDFTRKGTTVVAVRVPSR